MRLILLVIIISACLHAEEAWRFEKDTEQWRGRVKSIELKHIAKTGAVKGRRGYLHFKGKIEKGWNYVISGRRPMQGGRLYRLSAWVKVVRVGKGTPMPFLKCEFVGKNEPGRANTNTYDGSKMNTWQKLWGEFKAPEGTEKCWVAVEKGGNAPMEIEACLDEVIIQPIEKLTVLDQYRLDPIPRSLKKTKGKRPRLYLDAKEWLALKRAIKTTHKPMFKEIMKLADKSVRKGPPAYIKMDKYSGTEQLYQRGVGNAMPYLAMAWRLTGDRQYLASLEKWTEASCRYKTWGLGATDGMDLAAGHQLFGLAIAYDWCYSDLKPEIRALIRSTLKRRAQAMFEAAATRKIWWEDSYLQNHLWVNAMGMAAAGIALYGEEDQALHWIGLPLDRFKRTMEVLGPDGASHEGVGYWGYGVEYMLKFMHVARELLDIDMYDHDWWRNTAAYRLYMSLPREVWTWKNCIVDIADCPRNNWYGPEYLLRRLAAEYKDPQAQWLASEVDKSGTSSPSARWLNLVWYDPRIAPQPPDDLPTLRHFRDMDIVSARSGWDGKESLVVFKCGPFIGHEAVEAFRSDPGGGHVHPDANHFVLFGSGEWLIRDDGYRAKYTGQHNTLLIDRKGQLGEGKQWFAGSEALAVKSRPKIIRAVSTPAMDHIIGDAREAYPAGAGLKKYARHVLFVKPNILIVIDDIELSRAADLELRFHPESRVYTKKDGAVFLTGKQAVLRAALLTPEDVQTDIGVTDASGRHGEKEQLFSIRISRSVRAWQNACAFSWSSRNQTPPAVTLTRKKDIWVFDLPGGRVEFSWKDGKAVFLKIP